MWWGCEEDDDAGSAAADDHTAADDHAASHDHATSHDHAASGHDDTATDNNGEKTTRLLRAESHVQTQKHVRPVQEPE